MQNGFRNLELNEDSVENVVRQMEAFSPPPLAGITKDIGSKVKKVTHGVRSKPPRLPSTPVIPGERASSRRKTELKTEKLSLDAKTRLTRLTGLSKQILIAYAESTLKIKVPTVLVVDCSFSIQRVRVWFT